MHVWPDDDVIAEVSSTWLGSWLGIPHVTFDIHSEKGNQSNSGNKVE
jgi:hypothetical protein